MSTVLDELVQQLALERIEDNLFRGVSQDLGWGRVFGGQVLGQALSAAVQTVPADRHAHSLHAYFLRPGNVNKPIVYDVDRIRDGQSLRYCRTLSRKPITSLILPSAGRGRLRPRSAGPSPPGRGSRRGARRRRIRCSGSARRRASFRF